MAAPIIISYEARSPPVTFRLLAALALLCVVKGGGVLAEEGGAARYETARRIAGRFSDAELAGEVIMAGVDAAGTVSRDERERLARFMPGAMVLFGKNLRIPREKIQEMTTALSAARTRRVVFVEGGVEKSAALLPFIACDHEGGSVQRVTEGGARLPAPLSYGETAKERGAAAAQAAITRDAARAAAELSRLGINMNLAPVAEALTAENRPFLENRAYGEDSAWTALAAAAFTQAMQEKGVACVVKHFPGNSAVDPHERLPVLRMDEAGLQGLAAPFYAVIAAASPAGVMAAHSVAAAWDPARSASLSPIVIGDKLVGRGFEGIVIADDFSMGAVAGVKSAEEAAVEALAAGADMVMAWPANLGIMHRAICAALARGALKRERLIDAAARIISQKIRFGLLRQY
jgi:beta-N-acetylhexosaminidase